MEAISIYVQSDLRRMRKEYETLTPNHPSLFSLELAATLFPKSSIPARGGLPLLFDPYPTGSPTYLQHSTSNLSSSRLTPPPFGIRVIVPETLGGEECTISFGSLDRGNNGETRESKRTVSACRQR